MNLALRTAGALLLLLALAIAGAWIGFPFYAQALIDRVTGHGVIVKVTGIERPGLSGIGFRRVDAIIVASKDTCTGITPVYSGSLWNGRVSWKRFASGKIGVDLIADSLKARQMPAGILFSDRHPKLRASIGMGTGASRQAGTGPDSITYRVDGGVIETGKLRVEGVSYPVTLSSANGWVQQPAAFRAATLFSDGNPTPLSGFGATFGLQRHPEKPCTLTFTDCHVDIFGIPAKTANIEYNLRKKQTRFILALDGVPLDKISRLAADKKPGWPSLSGSMEGALPVEMMESTLRITSGRLAAAPGSRIEFRDGGSGKPSLTFDAGSRPGAPPLISGLDAEVTIHAGKDGPSAIRIGRFTSKIFGGSATVSPTGVALPLRSASCTVRLDKVPLLDRIVLQGQFSGKLNGSVSGTIPIHIGDGGFSIANASISSNGGGSILQPPPRTPGRQDLSMTTAGERTLWSFRNPRLVLNRTATGTTTVRFALAELRRRSGEGELLLDRPKGTITFSTASLPPAMVSLTGFSAGLLDGSIAIDRVDYDLRKKHAATTVQLDGIALQKLLDLQGTKKITATGSVRGRLPVVLDGETFSIPNGGMNAEKTGLIVYATTPEEREAANAGMRLTYEALGNFLYSELLSSITMAPDGQSHITLQLKGYNPEFQNGRPVNLNLQIEQNLTDLFRSLSISSGIEKAITEKALRNRNGKTRPAR